jgi:TorA-specific chaperone
MSQVNKEIKQEISEEKAARAVVYNFLSSLFAKEVTSDLVVQLTSAQGQSFLNSLALEPSLTGSIDGIKAKFATLNNEESLLELAADFCGLFLVDGRTSVSPYAGQYVNAKPSENQSEESGSRKKKDCVELFGELHQKVTEFLTDSKLQVHSDFPEPGDHIAVILAYIAHLCVTAETKEQLNFIKCYLMTWLSDFTQKVNEHDHGLFYCYVADLTLAWLKVDTEFFPNNSRATN